MKWSKTREEMPRPFGLRLRGDQRHMSETWDIEHFTRDEMLLPLEKVETKMSRPRLDGKIHITKISLLWPSYGKTKAYGLQLIIQTIPVKFLPPASDAFLFFFFFFSTLKSLVSCFSLILVSMAWPGIGIPSWQISTAFIYSSIHVLSTPVWLLTAPDRTGHTGPHLACWKYFLLSIFCYHAMLAQSAVMRQ